MQEETNETKSFLEKKFDWTLSEMCGFFSFLSDNPTSDTHYSKKEGQNHQNITYSNTPRFFLTCIISTNDCDNLAKLAWWHWVGPFQPKVQPCLHRSMVKGAPELG